MSTSGIISAVLAVLAFLITDVFKLQLTAEDWTNVQKVVSELIVLGGLAWTTWTNWKSGKDTKKLTAQVHLAGETPVAGPKKGEMPSGSNIEAAKEILSK